MTPSDWVAIAIISIAALTAWAMLWSSGQAARRLDEAASDAHAEEMADIRRRWEEVDRINAETARKREQLRELQRHPVGSVEGYRLAHRHFMDDPDTKDDRCSNSTPHARHLWRIVFDPNGADTSMRRCDGGAT